MAKIKMKSVDSEEIIYPYQIAGLVKNCLISPTWLVGEDQFWYRREIGAGHEFVLVDANSGHKSPLFNHRAVARALSAACGETLAPHGLLLAQIEVSTTAIDFSGVGKHWRYQRDSETLVERQLPAMHDGDLLSPNKKLAVFRAGANLCVRDIDRGIVNALTNDGSADYAYAKSPDCNAFAITLQRSGMQPFVVALWSPDSRKLFSYRLDERAVESLFLVQSALDEPAQRQKLYSYRAPKVGQENVAQAALMVFDIGANQTLYAAMPPLAVTGYSLIELRNAWWSDDSRFIYFVKSERGERLLTLCEMDATTGAVRELIVESNATFVELALDSMARPNVRTLPLSREIIWFSERDGWGHLYLYDMDSGALKQQITHGPWLVRELLYVCEAQRYIVFSAAGREPDRDPYWRHIYRINFDGSGLQLLTPEHADHYVVSSELHSLTSFSSSSSLSVGVSPSGRFFVETYGAMGMEPVNVLRNMQGEPVVVLEKGDLGALLQQGWRWPETFKVKDRDNEYDIYGNIFYPPAMIAGKKYPVIDMIYPGPQIVNTAKSPFVENHIPLSVFSAHTFFQAKALSSMGFIVVTLDGLGTPLRCKNFHDKCFGNMQDASLPDHIAAVKQLAQTRSHMDLERVGIYGSSAGGYAAVRALLAYPQFYKVGVAGAVVEIEDYFPAWGEKYQGAPQSADYSGVSNIPLAKNLLGKLLVVYSDMDDNVNPMSTVKLIDAFIKADRDFDLLLLPNQSHFSLIMHNPYLMRRLSDYFKAHL